MKDIDTNNLIERCDALIEGFDKLINDIDMTLNPKATKPRRKLTLVKRLTLKGGAHQTNQHNLYNTKGTETRCE